MKYYSTEHEWVEIKGEVGVVGISSHAAEELGDITFVELPEIGTQVKQGEPLGVIESVKAAADIYSPISGEVIEVNKKLEESPEIINQDPEGDGWICKLKKVIQDEVESLMDEVEYQNFLNEKK